MFILPREASRNLQLATLPISMERHNHRSSKVERVALKNNQVLAFLETQNRLDIGRHETDGLFLAEMRILGRPSGLGT